MDFKLENKPPLAETKLRKSTLGSIEWLDYEYDHHEKSSDWFWITGAIAAGGVLLSFIFTNFLLAIIILIGAFTVIMFARREPELVHFEITSRGIKIKQTLYPFTDIKSFALKEDAEPFKLMIESGRFIFPHIIIPLGQTDPEDVREYLENFIYEEPFEESIIDNISEILGF